MKYLGYILTYSLIWGLHLLPRRLFYMLSDLLYLLVRHVAGYRKQIVRENISRAFPDFSPREAEATARKFYHHLCDLILESAAAHFWSEDRINRRMTYRNPEILDRFYREGKQVIAVTAHYGNWELLSNIGSVTPHTILAAYKPLKNKYFDKLIRENRERFKLVTVPMDQIARRMIRYHRDKEPALTIFLSDQRPMMHNIQYWTRFLGQDTPLFLGAEKLARKLEAAVIFLKIRKLARGSYEAEIVPVCDDPAAEEPYQITETHVRILEDLIREEPAYWLWSHRRWKHSYREYLEKKEKSDPFKDPEGRSGG